MSLYFIGKITKLKSEAERVIGQLPILGEESGEAIVSLAHFSREEFIQSFRPSSHSCIWTNTISSEIELIRRMTADTAPDQYKAIYLVRVRMKTKYCQSELVPRISNTKSGFEYALNIDISQPEFGIIHLTYEQSTRLLLPR